MKKTFKIALLCAVVAFAWACQGTGSSKDAVKRDFVAEAKAVVDEIALKSSEWDTLQWINEMDKMYRLQLDFYKSMPTQEELTRFIEVQGTDDPITWWQNNTTYEARNIMRAANIIFQYDNDSLMKAMTEARDALEKHLGRK